MLEEIMLDKARIAREAGDGWSLASENFIILMEDPKAPWVNPGDMAVDWLTERVQKALGMTESELRRAVKSYLNTWVRNETRRRIRAALPEEASDVEAIEWPSMLDDLMQAERVARHKAGKKNLTAWVAPIGAVSVGGEIVDYTSHEFWTDMYIYALESPQRAGESRQNFIRRMGDAGANAKYASEKMPQPHNGTKRSYSMSAAPSDSIAASIDGAFDEDYQTAHRPIGADRRPMDLREEDWEVRPVTTRKASHEEVEALRELGARSWARDPLYV